MFIAGEMEGNDVDLSMPIDRSTGPVRSSLYASTATLGRHARRFVLVSAAVLLAGCSQLKLGYNNADMLLAYSLDSYLKLDDEQEKLAREKIAALHRWHRGQLGAYVQLLDEAQAKVAGPVDADDVRRFNTNVTRLLTAVGEQAAPDLARLALTLKPAQIDRMTERLASDSTKARRELVRYTGPESLEQRVDRAVESAEEWLGRLTPQQRELIRASLAGRADGQELWIAERERRGRDAVALFTRIRSEQPPLPTATAWIREYFAQMAEPRDPEQRARLERGRQESAELVAQLINSATPAQRATLQKKLRSYATDFATLAAEASAAGRG